jgi:hypothetical protein
MPVHYGSQKLNIVSSLSCFHPKLH